MGSILGKTVAHFWPEFRQWLDELRDTRDPDRITYASRFLTWLGLMTFLLKLGSRRQLNFELDSPMALKNLNRLSGCAQQKIAHHDTLNHFLGHVHPAEFAGLRRKMVFRLLRMKVLDAGRLMGHFLIVLDGTGQLQFREPHCPHCLEETVNGTTYYYHNVLEAKLVTPEGLALSVGSEFIENADQHASKQDCGLRAEGLLPADQATQEGLPSAAAVPSPGRSVCQRAGDTYLPAEPLEVYHRLQGGQPAGRLAGVPGAARAVPAERQGPHAPRGL
jgi:hypothetical protein